MYDNDGNKVLVQDKIDDDYCGLQFPGGHVEKGESFTDAVIREVFEETGLTISSPELYGIKDWSNDDDSRYMVLFYKTNKFEGQFLSDDILKKYTQMDKATAMYRRMLEQNIGNGYLLKVEGYPHCIAWWDATLEKDMPDSAELICMP